MGRERAGGAGVEQRKVIDECGKPLEAGRTKDARRETNDVKQGQHRGQRRRKETKRERFSGEEEEARMANET